MYTLQFLGSLCYCCCYFSLVSFAIGLLLLLLPSDIASKHIFIYALLTLSRLAVSCSLVSPVRLPPSLPLIRFFPLPPSCSRSTHTAHLFVPFQFSLRAIRFLRFVACAEHAFEYEYQSVYVLHAHHFIFSTYPWLMCAFAFVSVLILFRLPFSSHSFI